MGRSLLKQLAAPENSLLTRSNICSIVCRQVINVQRGAAMRGGSVAPELIELQMTFSSAIIPPPQNQTIRDLIAGEIHHDKFGQGLAQVLVG